MPFAEGQDIFNAIRKKNSAESPQLLAVLQRPCKPSRRSPAGGGACRSTGPSQHPAQKAPGNSRAEVLWESAYGFCRVHFHQNLHY